MLIAETILLRGATGTVGSEVVRQLSEEEISVYAACSTSERISKINKCPRIKIVTGFDYEKPES
jgi:uncharacterized protein YbjT (DUF2867 family)